MGKKKKKNLQFSPGIVNDKAQVLDVKRALDAYTNPAANLGAGATNLAETAGYIMQRFTIPLQIIIPEHILRKILTVRTCIKPV